MQEMEVELEKLLGDVLFSPKVNLINSMVF